MTIWSMRIGCWIIKAATRHSEYVLLIALPLKQWLNERPYVLRHTYIACLVADHCLVGHDTLRFD